MKPKLSNFKEFADKILQVAFDGNDLDGSDIQDIGVECGLLKEVMATEPVMEIEEIYTEIKRYYENIIKVANYKEHQMASMIMLLAEMIVEHEKLRQIGS